MAHQGKYIDVLYRTKYSSRKEFADALILHPTTVNDICDREVVDKDLLIKIGNLLGEDLILRFYPQDIDHLILALKYNETLEENEYLKIDNESMRKRMSEMEQNFKDTIALYEKKNPPTDNK